MGEDLLHLIQEFPQAFADPESPAQNSESENALSLQDTNSAAVNQRQLLDLIDEFPQAFADPEPPLDAGLGNGAAGVAASQEMPAEREPSIESGQPNQTPPHLPAGYACALRRRVPTFTWGQVDFNLIYGVDGLAELWITAGKSGTEVQSLCEAIARLINLLLAKQIPIPEIVREIRGIRGADSEGFGPHRVLGLADLIGKVLQEAPAQWGVMTPNPTQQTLHDGPPTPEPREPEQLTAKNSAQDLASSNDSALAEMETPWGSVEPPTGTSASLCPECGAELNQVNGCKGGACVVCGYSSCS